jgi:hypothetical protein
VELFFLVGSYPFSGQHRGQASTHSAALIVFFCTLLLLSLLLGGLSASIRFFCCSLLFRAKILSEKEGSEQGGDLPKIGLLRMQEKGKRKARNGDEEKARGGRLKDVLALGGCHNGVFVL